MKAVFSVGLASEERNQDGAHVPDAADGELIVVLPRPTGCRRMHYVLSIRTTRIADGTIVVLHFGHVD